MGKIAVLGLVLIALSIAACERDSASNGDEPLSPGQTLAPGSSKLQRAVDFSQISSGAALYKEKCAECHGANAEGDPAWRVRGEDGLYPAPPLNGSGHSWHHPQQILLHVIKNGSPGGQGKMPAWKEKLTDQQIEDVIAWFQSRWPDEQYVTWQDIDSRARNRSVSR